MECPLGNSDDMKFSTWRKLWVALAEGEKELGLNISEDQINELKANIYNINYDDAIKREKEVRQLVTAASDGAIAALNAVKYIQAKQK